MANLAPQNGDKAATSVSGANNVQPAALSGNPSSPTFYAAPRPSSVNQPKPRGSAIG